MNIAGTSVYNTNFRLRMYAIILVGIVLFGSLLYWRANVILSAEAVDFPVHKEKTHGNSQADLDLDAM